MAGISSLGSGSGMDLNGLIDKLMTAEKAPLQALVLKEASYQAKISAYGSVKSALSAFQTAGRYRGNRGICKCGSGTFKALHTRKTFDRSLECR